MENNKVSFEYTYSAEQQAEIEKIRKKYMPKTDDKLAQIRKLDESVTTKGTMISICVGVIGTLLFGAGLSVALIRGIDLLWMSLLFAVPGLLLMIAAYPLFKKVTDKERERIAPQILALTEELGQ